MFSAGTVSRCLDLLNVNREQTGSDLDYDVLDVAPGFFAFAANDIVLDFCESVMGPFLQLDGLTIVRVGKKRERSVFPAGTEILGDKCRYQMPSSACSP